MLFYISVMKFCFIWKLRALHLVTCSNCLKIDEMYATTPTWINCICICGGVVWRFYGTTQKVNLLRSVLKSRSSCRLKAGPSPDPGPAPGSGPGPGWGSCLAVTMCRVNQIDQCLSTQSQLHQNPQWRLQPFWGVIKLIGEGACQMWGWLSSGVLVGGRRHGQTSRR